MDKDFCALSFKEKKQIPNGECYYFKKYIPLMSIKQIDQKKAYVEIIENISLDRLGKKANWLKENLNLFRLSNPLFKNMKNTCNKLIKVL